MVDAVFASVLHYFDVFKQFKTFDFFGCTPRVCAWRAALAASASAQGAVSSGCPPSLRAFLLARESVLSKRIRPSVAV